MRITRCLAASLLAPVVAWPQPAPQRVVVTGSLAEQALEDAPFAVSVLDADELRASGPLVDLSEAMARVPG